jgi:hypothetical protein
VVFNEKRGAKAHEKAVFSKESSFYKVVSSKAKAAIYINESSASI